MNCPVCRGRLPKRTAKEVISSGWSFSVCGKKICLLPVQASILYTASKLRLVLSMNKKTLLKGSLIDVLNGMGASPLNSLNGAFKKVQGRRYRGTHRFFCFLVAAPQETDDVVGYCLNQCAPAVPGLGKIAAGDIVFHNDLAAEYVSAVVTVTIHIDCPYCPRGDVGGQPRFSYLHVQCRKSFIQEKISTG